MSDKQTTRQKLQAAVNATYDWAEGSSTMAEGADSDGVADIEPWQDAEGENVTGEHGVLPATFAPDIGGPAEGEPGPPIIVQVEERLPVQNDRPQDWTTNRATLEVSVAKRIASHRPDRYSLLITNTHATDAMFIGPRESQCFRTIAAGKSYEADHTAEVWAKGQSADVTCEVDESFTVNG